MKTDHLSKESIIAVQKMRTQIPALGYVVTPEDAIKMAEIIDAEMAHDEEENSMQVNPVAHRVATPWSRTQSGSARTTPLEP